ncbi:hypothetical protein AGMMS49928_20500 [Spirochaetia bacterium]|nr:hypothetical protein AGMMS49928_20500 [Spirochaetia bacterium]
MPSQVPGGGLLKKIENSARYTDDSPGDSQGGSPVIEERDGVPYIKKEALSSGGKTGGKLNPEFKKLIDSIM